MKRGGGYEEIVYTAILLSVFSCDAECVPALSFEYESAAENARRINAVGSDNPGLETLKRVHHV
jgi:hypothetical protein